MRRTVLTFATVLSVGITPLAVAAPARLTGGPDGVAAGPRLAPYQVLSQASPAYFAPPDGTEAAGGGPQAASTDAATPVTITPAAAVRTPEGAPAVVPIGGRRHETPGDYLLVHRHGDVSRRAADGSTVWNRLSPTFHADWGKGHYRAPEVRTGYDAFDPYNRVSPASYAVGRLGNGQDEYLAVAHFAWWIDRNFQHGYFVTIVDVETGATVWTRAFTGAVTQLLIHDGALLIGHETGDPGSDRNEPTGAPGSRSELVGIAFGGGRQLNVRREWTWSTGASWARWLAATPADRRTAVFAWTATTPGSGGASYGQVLAVDVSTGTPDWTAATAGYPRLLGYDAGRKRVVVAEQADPATAWAYTLRSLAAADGAATGQALTRPDSVPFALAVGDVAAAPGAEWVATEAQFQPAEPVTRVTATRAYALAVGGDDGALAWRADASAPPLPTSPGWQPMVPHPSALTLLPDEGPASVLVGTYFAGTEPSPMFTRRHYIGASELRALDGRTGATTWQRTGDVLSPLALAPYAVDGRPAVLTATGRMVVHAYGLAGGEPLRTTPVLGEITAADAADVNGDGVADLLVGGQSEAVFALDGRTLGHDPDVLWATPVEGEVHEIRVVRLPGGDLRIAVAAATAVVKDSNQSYPVAGKSAVDVLAADGTQVFRFPALPDFAWTLEVGTPGGEPAVVVPTRTLTAYSLTDGRRLWRFDPAPVIPPAPVMHPVSFSSTVVTSDGDVAVQWFVKGRLDVAGQRLHPTTTPNNHVVALIDGSTGLPVWQVPVPSPGSPHLWRGVAGEVATATGSPGVGFLYQSGQWGLPTNSSVDVYDLATGVRSYGVVLRGYFRALVAPHGDLMSYGGIFEIASITPAGATQRRTSPTPGDLAAAHSARFGDVLVTSDPLGGIGVYDRTPTATAFPLLARAFGDVDGSRLRIVDLDGDGSDEVLQFSYDWTGVNAAQNEVGTFSIAGGDGGIGGNGIEVYRLD